MERNEVISSCEADEARMSFREWPTIDAARREGAVLGLNAIIHGPNDGYMAASPDWASENGFGVIWQDLKPV